MVAGSGRRGSGTGCGSDTRTTGALGGVGVKEFKLHVLVEREGYCFRIAGFVTGLSLQTVGPLRGIHPELHGHALGDRAALALTRQRQQSPRLGVERPSAEKVG